MADHHLLDFIVDYLRMNANLIATSGMLCSSTNHALMPRGLTICSTSSATAADGTARSPASWNITSSTGMTREEIAGRIKRPVSTVKTWLRRSLAQLKDCLGQ